MPVLDKLSLEIIDRANIAEFVQLRAVDGDVYLRVWPFRKVQPQFR